MNYDHSLTSEDVKTNMPTLEHKDALSAEMEAYNEALVPASEALDTLFAARVFFDQIGRRTTRESVARGFVLTSVCPSHSWRSWLKFYQHETDAEALQSDWSFVGRSLWEAILKKLPEDSSERTPKSILPSPTGR